MSSDFLTPFQARIETQLTSIFDATPEPERLLDAMRYATLGGGKRLRAALVYMSCNALALDASSGDSAAQAVELIHAYSLVHDDLPAMDDDDLRRGKPTTHRQFDEATAILAGDALQSLAFQVISEDESLTPEARIALIKALAQAVGANGMVGGQSLDMLAEGQRLSLEALTHIHNQKTGALIQFAAQAPGIIAGRHVEALQTFGHCLGLAFQIQDDILDTVGTEEVLGKQAGVDLRQAKSTYVGLLGLEGAKSALSETTARARAALTEAQLLTNSFDRLIQFVADRDH